MKTLVLILTILFAGFTGYMIGVSSVDPSSYYKENVCHYQHGTWHKQKCIFK